MATTQILTASMYDITTCSDIVNQKTNSNFDTLAGWLAGLQVGPGWTRLGLRVLHQHHLVVGWPVRSEVMQANVQPQVIKCLAPSASISYEVPLACTSPHVDNMCNYKALSQESPS